MKFPSLFRTPAHKRFHFEPRYYDPIKEDIARRTARIKMEQSGDKSSNYRTNISSAFARKSRQSNKSGLIQFSLIAGMFCTFFGYLYYGDVALYLMVGVLGSPYLFYRMHGLFKNR